METKQIKTIHYIITALFIFGFQFVPTFGAMTPYGMGILGTFIGAVYGWTFIGMIWPSLMALVGLGLVIGMPTMLASALGNPSVAMMFGIIPLVQVLSDLRMTEYLANKIFNNKFSLGKPWIAVTILFFGAFATAFISPIVCMFIFAAFAVGLCKNLGIAPYTKLPTTLLMGLAYAIMLGQILIPFLGAGLGFTVAYSGMFGTQMPYVAYMCFTFPMGIILLIAYVLIMRFVLRVDVSPLGNITADMLGTSEKMTKDQKMAGIFFICFVIVMLLSSVLPMTSPLYLALSKVSVFGIAVLFVGVMMVIKREDGTPLLDYPRMGKDFSWETFYLTTYIMVISTYLTAAGTGLNETIAMLLVPMTKMSPIVFIVGILLFAAIITNFANNMILTVIIMPVMYNFAMTVGMNPTGLIMMLFLSTQLALATPGASPITGIACAQHGLVKAGDFMKTSLIVIPILFAVTLVLGYAWMSVIF